MCNPDPTAGQGVDEPHRRPRRKTKAENPISEAVRQWLASVPSPQTADASPGADELVQTAPKRWVIYEPMVLLPSGSFNSAPWTTLLAVVPRDRKTTLWQHILDELSKTSKENLTHLAVNEGIPLAQGPAGEAENILRSPSGLRMLHGNFGPASTTSSSPDADEDDFDRAFWVSTKQNGIHQVWAPRWTMFSRGNVKEKARLLAFHDDDDDEPASEPSRRRRRRRAQLAPAWAVDLYGGIGYFVFSYARLGLRVLCWELNPWSVEGLRRGAARNGWAVRVIRGPDLALPTADTLAGAEEPIIVFLEDNQHAARRVDELRASGVRMDVSHVNCGFLPTSEPSWRSAWDIVGDRGEGWMHLHENVGAKDIEARREAIAHMLGSWSEARAADVEHVELVKTYAPDVWHCVFDVYITTSNS